MTKISERTLDERMAAVNRQLKGASIQDAMYVGFQILGQVAARLIIQEEDGREVLLKLTNGILDAAKVWVEDNRDRVARMAALKKTETISIDINHDRPGNQKGS